MKCLVYPYSDDMYPIIENLHIYSLDVEISAIVYPKAWRKHMDSISRLEGIYSGDDFSEALEKAECVILADVSDKEYMYDDIIRKASAALASGKKIKCCTYVKNDDLADLKKKYPDADIEMLYSDGSEYGFESYRHERITVPAVGISGMYRGLDNVFVSVGMSCGFRSKGYRTITVTPNCNGRLLGFYPFPTGIFKSESDVEQQTEMLNSYFYRLSSKEKCDLMIVQFPDGMTKYSVDSRDAYGVKAYMITRAVPIDYFVMVSPLTIRDRKIYDELSAMFRNKFDMGIDACVVQPVQIDGEYTAETRNISFTYCGTDDADDVVSSLASSGSGILFSKIGSPDAGMSMTESCIAKLTN